MKRYHLIQAYMNCTDDIKDRIPEEGEYVLRIDAVQEIANAYKKGFEMAKELSAQKAENICYVYSQRIANDLGNRIRSIKVQEVL